VEVGARAEAVELGVIDGPLLIHPVVDEGRASRLGRDDSEEGEIVDIEPRVRARMNLLGDGNKLGGLN